MNVSIGQGRCLYCLAEISESEVRWRWSRIMCLGFVGHMIRLIGYRASVGGLDAPSPLTSWCSSGHRSIWSITKVLDWSTEKLSWPEVNQRPYNYWSPMSKMLWVLWRSTETTGATETCYSRALFERWYTDWTSPSFRYGSHIHLNLHGLIHNMESEAYPIKDKVAEKVPKVLV